jgi:energy-coupling factor transporter ATP-binding protein EcfA2
MNALLQAQAIVFRTGVQSFRYDFSLDFHAGEVVSVLGPNGSGKNQLAQDLIGLLKPQSAWSILKIKSSRLQPQRTGQTDSLCPPSTARPLPTPWKTCFDGPHALSQPFFHLFTQGSGNCHDGHGPA